MPMETPCLRSFLLTASLWHCCTFLLGTPRRQIAMFPPQGQGMFLWGSHCRCRSIDQMS